MEIITLKDGEKITENGFYSMSLDRHHDQPCDGISVTSGVLRGMELKTPGDVWAFHKLNPDRFEQADRAALWLGRAMASYIEGGEDELQKHFFVLPPNPPRRPTQAQIGAFHKGTSSEAGAASVMYWARIEKEEGQKTILRHEDFETVRAMGDALLKDPAACAALGGEPEITMAVYDQATNLWMLARPDQVSFSGMLSDYKKVSARGGNFDYRLCDRRCTDHGYYMQMAFAATCFERLTGNWPNQVGLVYQCESPPYFSILREVDEETLRLGEYRNTRAMARFRECLDSGHWPGPGEDIGAYQMPEWLYTRLLEDQNITEAE